MIFILLFVFGAIVGSFLNVVALRWNTGINLGGRSACATCQKPLVWWELFPVLGFFFVRGRCSSCKSKISWQYPLIEILTGAIFASLWSLTGVSLTIYGLSVLVFFLYIVILIYDARHKIIPDPLVLAAIGLGILLRLIVHASISDWLAGPILFSFFALIWLLSKGRAMGFGDAKLALSIGLLLGLPLGLSAVVLAFWIGTVYSLFLIGRKGLTMKSEVPFAPFLILGAWLSLFLHLDLFHVLTFF